MKIQIVGMDKLQKTLNNMSPKVYNAVEKELKIITLDLQGKAQQLAPVDTGDLKGSAFADVSGPVGTVGFTEPYALRQHESMGFKHPKGGEAKYLENPYKENKDKYIDAIKDAAKKAVEP